MALLTEEQIKQLVEMASVPIYLYDKICEWNEKQTAQQVEVDWNDAPKYATKAVLRIHWVTEAQGGSELWSASFDSVTFERPKPVITPHPHAALMMKYAEVASRRINPWVEFEFRNLNSQYGWDVLSGTPSFESFYEYRYIGDNK